MNEILKVIFFIAKTAYRASSTETTYSKHSIAIHYNTVTVASYVTVELTFVRSNLPALVASNFCDFLKLFGSRKLFSSSKPYQFRCA